MHIWRVLCVAALFAAPMTPVVATADQSKVSAGRKILAENNCNGSCHQSYSEDNDPLTLYTRKNRIVKDHDGLINQINKCILLLNAPIFPEDIDSIAAALEHDYYHFLQNK